MTHKDFWHNSKVGVIGGGSWGSALAHLASFNCREVRVWIRNEDSARSINATRSHSEKPSSVQFGANVHAFSSIERVFEEGVNIVIWALPSKISREQARSLAPLFKGDELLIHGTKGIEHGSLKRMSEVLKEELPCRRIGVISGPNLANEVIRGEPAATVVASTFSEVCDLGQYLFANPKFRVYRDTDVIGVEWAGTLKNILAIASGALDALNLGWNSRAMLMTRGLAEMVRFGAAMGGKESTFLGLAGVGDLLATCSSNLSRNYRVGNRLAKGESLEVILDELESTAEGVLTTKTVWEYASQHKIVMPITEGVYRLLKGNTSAEGLMKELMTRPHIG
jgi:glycerol-3-phosphate dehydrogenase (NAD(P)+)